MKQSDTLMPSLPPYDRRYCLGNTDDLTITLGILMSMSRNIKKFNALTLNGPRMNTSTAPIILTSTSMDLTITKAILMSRSQYINRSNALMLGYRHMDISIALVILPSMPMDLTITWAVLMSRSG